MNANMRMFIVVSFLIASLAAASARATVELGDKAMKSCGYREAIKHYKSAPESNPSDGEIIVRLAKAYDGAKWFGQSVELWESYLFRFPRGKHVEKSRERAAMNHRWLGSEMFLIGDPAENAREHLTRAIELEPELIDAHIWMARVLASEGRFDEETETLDRASRFAAEDETVIALRKEASELIRMEGASHEAIKHGISLYDRGYEDSALSVFRAVEAANEQAPTVHYWAGRILSEKNLFAEAAREFRKLSRLNPGKYRFAFLHAQAQQNAGAPMREIAFLSRSLRSYEPFRSTALPASKKAPCAPEEMER